MYGDGEAEEIVGEVLAGQRGARPFIVSKVYPHNASRRGTVADLRAQPEADGLERIDLYLLALARRACSCRNL
jgi:diketogulonate reductase-like aldo/keto reductase